MFICKWNRRFARLIALVLPLLVLAGAAKARAPVSIKSDYENGSSSVNGGWHDVPFYRRTALRTNHRFAGPCVVVQDDCTACVPPGFGATVDVQGNIVLELAE